MHCPHCQSENIKVIRSEHRPEKNSTNRRIQCLDCNQRFTTIEFVVPEGLRPDPEKLMQYWLEIRRAPLRRKPKAPTRE
jgi:hypothetical protein